MLNQWYSPFGCTCRDFVYEGIRELWAGEAYHLYSIQKLRILSHWNEYYFSRNPSFGEVRAVVFFELRVHRRGAGSRESGMTFTGEQ
eukprot:scaffold5765_cov74-Skeletonema_dohrnii-CCMP3373.AAC.1